MSVFVSTIMVSLLLEMTAAKPIKAKWFLQGCLVNDVTDRVKRRILGNAITELAQFSTFILETQKGIVVSYVPMIAR